MLIPLSPDSGRPVRANLSIDASLLEAIDEAARPRGLTRLAFIASAAREKIAAEVDARPSPRHQRGPCAPSFCSFARIMIGR